MPRLDDAQRWAKVAAPDDDYLASPEPPQPFQALPPPSTTAEKSDRDRLAAWAQAQGFRVLVPRPVRLRNGDTVRDPHTLTLEEYYRRPKKVARELVRAEAEASAEADREAIVKKLAEMHLRAALYESGSPSRPEPWNPSPTLAREQEDDLPSVPEIDERVSAGDGWYWYVVETDALDRADNAGRDSVQSLPEGTWHGLLEEIEADERRRLEEEQRARREVLLRCLAGDYGTGDTARCQNPTTCERHADGCCHGPVKAAGRCAPCYAWLRNPKHRGQERPAKQIHRLRRRKGLAL